MKKIIVLLLCSVLFNFSFAQDALTYTSKILKSETKTEIFKLPVFSFSGYSYDYELENITKDMAGNHPFGDEIAKKMFLLSKKYTSEVELIPGNPQTKTVIQKPVIYNAVKRIEKHLKKSVKKGSLSVDPATYTLNKVLDVALCIRNADTKNFEGAIETSDSDENKIDLFTNRVNLIY